MMEKQAVDEDQGRKRAKTERSAETPDETEDEPVEAQHDGSALTDWTFRKLISCSKSVVALKDPSTKRRVSEIFLEKPDASAFPDYYEIVDKPVGINDILRKCRAKLYPDLREFRDDWKLMFANARKFNGEGSWVVEDAVALEKELERVLKKNGFTDDDKPPTSKKKRKLRIKLSLKGIKPKASVDVDVDNDDDDDSE
jgi:ATP-dependent helicase STH1/SNF2